MPVRYPLQAVPETDGMWEPKFTNRPPAGGKASLALRIGTFGALIVACGLYLGYRLSTDRNFDASNIAANYGANSFESVTLSNGQGFYGHLVAKSGLLIISDPYFMSRVTGSLVQGYPASASTGPSIGPGKPLVVNPAQVVMIEPVDPRSPLGREISRIETKEALARAQGTTTTTPKGFQ